MTAINGFQSVSAAVGATGTGAGAGSDAASAARNAVGEIGERVSAWVQSLAPGGAAPAGGFQPDRATLSRGGDVYGLRQIAGDIEARFGATPTQAGELSRALEGVARGAAVEAVLLHGSSGEAKGLSAALEAAAGTDGGMGGIDDVTARLEQAAGAFARQAG